MWKQATTKLPTNAMVSLWKSGIVFGFRREAVHPAKCLSAVFPKCARNSCIPQQYQSINEATQLCHGQYHSNWRCSNHACHRHRIRNRQRPCGSFFDLATASTPSLNHSQQQQQQRTFHTTPTLYDSPNKNTWKQSKKGQKNSNSSKQNRTPPPVHKMAAGMGMTLEECSSYLVKECSEMRHIELNKRQRLKPWIMALLVHRYDRGIRDIDELNTDSVYYNGGGSSNAAFQNSIDLRNVLTPDAIEIGRYIAATQKEEEDKRSDDEEQIREILRHEKLALLATEARRILLDREIPFQDMADLSNEARVRKMSKQDPSVFLSLFSRAFCVFERRQQKKRKQNDRPNFSHRRFHPPSLKSASYKHKKLKERRNRELAEKKKAEQGKNYHHRSSPRALQQKLRVMSQRNRIKEA